MKIHPYYINNHLRKKGWKYDDTGVYIPFDSPIKGEMYLKLSKTKDFFNYELFERNSDDPLPIRNITRNKTLKNDITYNDGQYIIFDPYGQPVFINEEPLTISFLRHLSFGKFMNEEEMKSFIDEIFDDINKSGCLRIFINSHYKDPDFEKFKKLEKRVLYSFSNRENVSQARQLLANWIKTRFDLVLRKNTHDIYILDEDNNCYFEITKDDLLIKISKYLKPQLINDEDLKTALSFISDRLDPQHNIVKFENCVYDMEKLEVVDNEDPVFTLIETSYKYNPDAKSTKLKDFLNSSLKKSTTKETEETILGVKQVVGYLFTSGNRLNLLPVITGVSGGGKSVFANILTEIFGKDKVADLKLQEIEKNTHATSSLINKHINIIQDSDDTTINNNSLIKQMTGNDSLQVNPKYVDPFVLPKEEVPKTIIVCNNIPQFKRLESALLERFLIIEFNVKFRGTDKENPDLLDEILDNPEEIEWFIYESIQAYKNMIDNEEGFILRKDDNSTRNIVDKHSHSINYLLNKVIVDHNVVAKNATNFVYTNDLNAIMRYLAKEEGIDLELNRNGIIPPKKLINTIRYEFDLPYLEYETKTNDGSRYYPNLITNNDYWTILKEIDPTKVPDQINEALFKEDKNKTQNT